MLVSFAYASVVYKAASAVLYTTGPASHTVPLVRRYTKAKRLSQASRQECFGLICVKAWLTYALIPAQEAQQVLRSG